MITVSDTAAAKFRELAADSKEPENQMLRIYFAGHG